MIDFHRPYWRDLPTFFTFFLFLISWGFIQGFCVFLFFFFCDINRNATTRGAMSQHLGAGIGMTISHLLSALSLQGKLACYATATQSPRIVICMSQETCTRMMLLHLPWLLFLAGGYVTNSSPSYQLSRKVFLSTKISVLARFCFPNDSSVIFFVSCSFF